MHDKVLGASRHLQMKTILSLQSGNILTRQHARQERVLTESLLTPSPSGIPEEIDVGRPEGQADILAPVARTDGPVMLCPGLIRDRRRHLPHQFPVKGRRHEDDLREYRRLAGSGNSMEALIPPVVFGYPEALYGRTLVAQLADLFFSRHLANELAEAQFHFLLERPVVPVLFIHGICRPFIHNASSRVLNISGLPRSSN